MKMYFSLAVVAALITMGTQAALTIPDDGKKLGSVTTPNISFVPRCSLPGYGPTDDGTLISGESGLRGPGYGHAAYNHTQDVFFVVKHETTDSNPNQRIAAIVTAVGNYSDCRVAWEFNTGATIVQTPMTDGEAVAIQTWLDGVVTAYTFNTTTGAIIWKHTVADKVCRECVITQVHDGRVFIATLAKGDAADEMLYTLAAWHGESGAFLWSWTNAAGRGSSVPAGTIAGARLWIAYNTVGNRGFAGYGSTVACFDGASGQRWWVQNLAPWHHGEKKTSSTLPFTVTSTSASAQMGYAGCPWIGSSSSSGSKLQRGGPSSPKLLYVVVWNASAFSGVGGGSIVALDQCSGQEVGPQIATQGAGSFQGSPWTSKYTPTVCVTEQQGAPSIKSPRSIMCFNGSANATAGAPLWRADAPKSANSGRGYLGVPSVGFTDPGNYVLDVVTTKDAAAGSSPQFTFQIFNQTTGALAKQQTVVPSAALSSKAMANITGVGAVELFENAWDLAVMGVAAKGQAGLFAIMHVQRP